MRESLADAEIVVTGAGRGLGRGVASVLAAEGARVWLCALEEDELQSTVADITAAGGHGEGVHLDLRDAAACDGFGRFVLDGTGRIDAIVNNAAMLLRAPFDEVSLNAWEDTLAVNLTAPFVLTRRLLPSLLESGGSVINVSSSAGVIGFPDEAAYCASKFGVEGLTKSLAAELQGTRVSVNTITPGLRLKPTSVTEADAQSLPREKRQEWVDPRDAGPAFVFLARLTGEVQGLRFDANRLSKALAEEDEESVLQRAEELAE